MTSAAHLEFRDQHPVSTELPIDLFSAQAVDLSHGNTMALACVADAVVTLTDEAQLDVFMTSYVNNSGHKPSLFVLSGGSNVLLPAQLTATVLQPQMRGIHLKQSMQWQMKQMKTNTCICIYIYIYICIYIYMYKCQRCNSPGNI